MKRISPKLKSVKGTVSRRSVDLILLKFRLKFTERKKSKMQKSNRPTKKLTLVPDLFNSLYATLLYFIATEATVGETQFSLEATKLKEQIDKYGRFNEAKNPDDSTFVIYYFDKEVMQIMNLLILQNTMKSSPGEDHFSQLVRLKKLKSQL